MASCREISRVGGESFGIESRRLRFSISFFVTSFCVALRSASFFRACSTLVDRIDDPDGAVVLQAMSSKPASISIVITPFFTRT
jgi:hypothetical protein